MRGLRAIVALVFIAAFGASAADAPKVLRYAFAFPETGFDPVQVIDVPSRAVIEAIFEPPLAYDYLARPARIVCNTAAELPRYSADFRELTIRIRPGILFQDDPAFGGRPRELTAADYVYSLKRFFDPRWKSPGLYVLESAGLVGMAALREQAQRSGRLNYDTEVEGLQALDRYTLRLRFEQPSPHFIHELTSASIFAAMAREVVEAAGDDLMARPVGTGPFRLAAWTTASRIVLERHPQYQALPGRTADDPAEPADARRRPHVDRIEISIIDESQPRWLAFLGGEHDLLLAVPNEFAPVAFPNNRLAPHLAQRGITMHRTPALSVGLTFFNMDDATVGGLSPERVALRRALGLAFDVAEEIRLVRRQQAIAAQSPIAPLSFGYDAAFRTDTAAFDRPRAKALLDLYGYVDRNGDGWREQPDGRPLALERATLPDQLSRQLDELWKKHMDAIGVRMVFKAATVPEQLKAARAGKLMMWSVTVSAGSPDGDLHLSLGYGPNKGQLNLARFELPAYDRQYERQRTLPDGPQRAQAFFEAKRLLLAYAPYKFHMHPVTTALTHPWVTGYVQSPYAADFWKYVDIDRRAVPR
jgi:ABC-type transport system substrate-binding protein